MQFRANHSLPLSIMEIIMPINKTLLLSTSLAALALLGTTTAYAADDASKWKKHVVFSDIILLDETVPVATCKELIADTDIEGSANSPQAKIVLHDKHHVIDFKSVAQYKIDQTYTLKIWEGVAKIKHAGEMLDAKTDVIGVINVVTGQVNGFWQNEYCRASYVSTPVENVKHF